MTASLTPSLTSMPASTRPARAGRRMLRRTLAALALTSLLGGCASNLLPKPPPRVDVFDFGPGLMQPAQPAGAAQATLAPIALGDFSSAGVPQGRTAMFYRLAYSNSQMLYPYTLARWSETPATLMQQAVRDRLSPTRAVIYGDQNVDQLTKDGKSPVILRAEVEEFSHVFQSTSESVGLVRVRASLVDSLKAGDALAAQRVFVAQKPALTPDAAGGAKALSDAALQVADEIAQWVAHSGR
ncbi:ABC-type transport auxiliary lipoprotein family protein [Diaphorobacter sp.]|uniref:ABC-type transport auxiliary lipoprotein family protein n=1 Tax=Diaphorobacter sp. TaxID=1934310 RepID=UPI0028B0FB55|nr:ABC-type transport auxiliary lipoprotein family protein [Diaphorobacter sp.]